MEHLRAELAKTFPKIEWDLIEFDDGDVHAESFVGLFRLVVLYKVNDGSAFTALDVPTRYGGGITLFRSGARDVLPLGLVLQNLRSYADVLRHNVGVMCGD